MAAHRASVSFPAIIPADLKCSICLENVVDDNLKGITKLQCGHFFHLACIGSEFNMKGAMVCPNCREVEDSEWKYSLGAYMKIPSHDESSDDEAVLAWVNTPESSFDQLQTISNYQRLLGFPYNGEAHEIPLFDYEGSSNNNVSSVVHCRQHTYVASDAPAAPAVPSNNSSGTDRHSIRIFNTTMSYCRQQHGNGTGFGGSVGPGSSAAAGSFAAQGLNSYRELDLLHTPESPAFHGSSSSAHPPALTLNTGEGTCPGCLAKLLEDANGSHQMTHPPVYGSAAYPIEIDL